MAGLISARGYHERTKHHVARYARGPETVDWMGLAGTGIGCFLDDELHRLLGLSDARLQALYCFSVGLPMVDPRIQTSPPYPHYAKSPEERSP